MSVAAKAAHIYRMQRFTQVMAGRQGRAPSLDGTIYGWQETRYQSTPLSTSINKIKGRRRKRGGDHLRSGKQSCTARRTYGTQFLRAASIQPGLVSIKSGSLRPSVRSETFFRRQKVKKQKAAGVPIRVGRAAGQDRQGPPPWTRRCGRTLTTWRMWRQYVALRNIDRAADRVREYAARQALKRTKATSLILVRDFSKAGLTPH